MGFSVNTNTGAMAALQSLTSTTKALNTTSNRITTGMNVASTKDNSAAYTTAQSLRSDLGGLQSVTSSLARAKSVTDVAIAGAEQISDIVNQMKAKAYQSADAGVDQASRDGINRDFTALRDQITTIVNASEFNGTNLLKASGGAVSALQSLKDGDAATAGYQPDALSVANQGLDLGGSVITVGASGNISTTAAATAMIDTLTTTQTNLAVSLSSLGSASRQIDAQSTFTSKLSDSIESGIGNLVDADLAKESARLQALQVKQQLGVQALSIANQAPQTITSLFR
ncbi:flagellin [Sphingomonas sp. 37zxx]|uniref:flagellin n=1 Tax=Sphingomonas sp. 37zxx TaxID=1550073 RepID=UPI00053BFDE4|nr:flagellin [Sphingomonas sp. 37zxx]